jgi:transcriptional regulator with PAS, ATPase and Fis domain
MMQFNWIKEFPAAVTVCDKEGIITEMNDKSAVTFSKDGGYDLIGKNLFNCHSQNSIEKIKELLNENKTNAYTIEKNGVKKLVYQAPRIENGEVKGLVELVIEIPFDMPHFIRQ